MAGAGAAALFVLPTQLLSNWFGKVKRGTATGITQTGNALVILLSGLIIPVVLLSFKYVSVWRVISIALFVIVAILFVVIRNKPADMGMTAFAATPEEIEMAAKPIKKSNPWSKESIKMVFGNKAFYLMLGAYFLFGFANTGFMTFRMNYLAEKGWDLVRVGRIITATGIFSLAGPPLIGVLSDKFEKQRVYAICMVVASLSMLILLLTNASMSGLIIGGSI